MSENEEFIGGCLSICVFIAFFVVIAYLVGVYNGENAYQKEAIKNKVGEYYFDKDYNRQFRWIPNNNSDNND